MNFFEYKKSVSGGVRKKIMFGKKKWKVFTMPDRR